MWALIPNSHQEVVKEIDEIAPVLPMLGYGPDTNPPNYGTSGKEVKKQRLNGFRNNYLAISISVYMCNNK